MKQPYFYIIQEVSTGTYYAGVKYSDPDSSNLLLENGYKTTSKIVKSILDEKGLDSFKILRVRHFDTSQEALDYEARFLMKVDAANNDRFYNRQNGGKNFCNKGGYNLNEVTKLKMSKPKTEETRKKMSKPKTEEHKRNLSESLKRRPKSVYKNSTKALIERNKTYWTDDIKENHSQMMKDYYAENGYPEETRKKLSEKNKGEGNPMYGKKHSDETRKKLKEAWARRKAQKNFDKK